MKKMCVLVLIQLLVFGAACYGAVSEDVYVRKDVFEAYLHGMNTKLDMILVQMKEQREETKAQIAELREETKTQISELKSEIRALREETKAQIDELREDMKSQRRDINDLSSRVTSLTVQVQGLNTRMGDLRSVIYLGIVILGIIIALPSVQKILQSLAERKPSLTIEDVKRLIEENNVRLSEKP